MKLKNKCLIVNIFNQTNYNELYNHQAFLFVFLNKVSYYFYV